MSMRMAGRVKCRPPTRKDKMGIIKALIRWLKELFSPPPWFSKVKWEEDVVDSGPTIIKYSPPASEYKARRAEKRYRKLNDKTRGAYGKPKATPHYSSMKRRKDD